jgi:hypothetical protein
VSYFTEQQLSDATPGTTMLAALETMLTAHASWTFVEEDSGYRVWKNNENDGGEDFHAVLRSDGALNLYVYGTEQWDVVTHRPKFPCPSSSSGYTVSAVSEAHSDDVETSMSYMTGHAIAGNVINYSYWMTVTRNGIYVFSEATAMKMVGLYEKLWSHANNGPGLYAGPLGIGSYSGAGTVSRRPTQAGIYVNRNFAAVTSNEQKNFNQVGGTLDPYYDVGSGPVATGARIWIVTYDKGHYFGLLRDDVLYFYTATAVNKGDTITLGASTFVYCGGYQWLKTDAV